jgi:ElaB/YqjD/DUF883 family membrane-anchored ribosome-binding protein
MDTQNQLISRQQDELTAVKDTVQIKMKSWADVVKRNDKQNRQLTAKSVKKAVKAVNEEEERSRNLIVYGDKEVDEADWEGVLKLDGTSEMVKSISELTECLDADVYYSCRIGEKKTDKTRPIKIQFRTSADVESILRRAYKLKSSDE